MSKSSVLCMIGRSSDNCAKYGVKLDSLQMLIFVYVCSTFSLVDLKTRFESLITRNELNNLNLFLFSYLITHMLYLCSHCAPKVQIVYFIFDWPFYRLFLLNRCRKLEPLQMMIFEHVCSTCSLVELKTRFETWIRRNALHGVNLFLFCYLITLTTYLGSQWAANVQMKCFKFDWSVNRLLVLNRGWKRDSHQMMIFVLFVRNAA
jgi:hypothetical protein